MKRARTRKLEALRRGLTRRCPHCGRGALFKRWVEIHDRCSACGMKFLLNHGDPFAFQAFTDRAIFVFPLVAGLFLGLYRAGVLAFAVFTGILVLLFVLTTPHRYGVCVALDYLTRLHWGDPSDVLPDLPAAAVTEDPGKET